MSPSSHTVDIHDPAVQQKFEQWLTVTKERQVRSITFLTGLLYMLAAVLDHLVAPSRLLPLMTIIHLYLLPPLLFLISLLTLDRRFANLTLILLMLAPIIAALGNLIITVGIERPSMRLTEIYLIIFWIFTVSGLRLRHATISAVFIVVIVFVMTYFFFSLNREYFVMHCFWMSAALSFGFLGAYLLEASYKADFINQEQLTQLVATDKLTGLYNRAKLDELLQNELDRSQRFHHTFGLVILDFDFFKEINDTFGHQVGDQVLIEISSLITEHLRSSDKAIRWGGEEFMLIYLETDKEKLMKLAEELRQKIEQHHFEKVGKKTVSLGATLYHKADTVTSIIKRADKALYMAKNRGRNCVVFL